MQSVFPNMPVLENVFIGSESIKQFEKTRGEIGATLKKITSFPYTIRGDKKELESFVIKNQLTNFLWEAIPHIRRIFGSDAQLFLELSDDPEGDFREIFIVIKTNHEINKALRLLERLDQEWFLSIINRVGNCLNITVANHNEF
ncbi:MAG TPA: hypothetical protein VGD14_18195 [bacterium]